MSPRLPNAAIRAAAFALVIVARAGNGHLDPAFNASQSGPNDQVLAIAVAPDDSILIGGYFWAVGSQTTPLVARLKPNGDADPSFQSPFPALTTGPVTAIAFAPGNKILVAGQLGQAAGNPVQAVVRLLPDGTVDPAFHANGTLPFFPTSVAADASGRVYLGAYENGFSGLVRLLADGTRDAQFAADYAAGVYGIAPLADGTVVVAGMGGIARLQSTGVRDPGFATGPDGPIFAFDPLSDGRLFVAGPFANSGGVPRPGIARLQASGLTETSFAPTQGADQAIERVLALDDGSAIVAGPFSKIGTAPRNEIARYAADGSLDAAFDAGVGPDGHVRALARQSTGAILVGGQFHGWNGLARPYLARLTPDGSADPGFVELADRNPVVREGVPSLVVTLRRSSGTHGAVSVALADFASAPGVTPATNGVQYTFAPQRVPFADGQSVATVAIAIANDDVVGPTHGFGLQIADPQGGVTLGAATTAQVTITDDDFGVSLLSTEYTVSELAGSIDVTLARVGTVLDPFTVEVETVEDSARQGIDFTPVRTRVEFAIDSGFASANIPILDNGILDGTRVFKVRLRDPIGTTHLLEPTQASVSIRDNERPGGLDPLVPRLTRTLALAAFYPRHDGSAIVVSNQFFNSLRLGKLLPDGKADPAFKSAVANVLATVGPMDDGRLLVFEAAPALNSSRVWRLLADGSKDPAFPTNILIGTGFPAVFPLPDGSFFLASNLVGAGTAKRTGLARFLEDGTLDPDFVPASIDGGYVKALVVDAQGRVHVGGSFTAIGNVPRRDVARLLPTGALDRTYRESPQTTIGGEVRVLAFASDGSLYVGGTFSKIATASRPCLVRLAPDGNVDPAFGIEGQGFATKSGVLAVANLALQPDGRVLVAGTFTRYQGHDLAASLLRLMPDGSIDPDFDTGIIGTGNGIVPGVVTAMRILGDGELMIGGKFTTIDGTDWPSIARLHLGLPVAPPDAPRFAGATVGGDGVVHLRLEVGVTGKFALESSDTLGDWQTISTHDLVPAVLELTDTPAPETNTRFYRLRSVP